MNELARLVVPAVRWDRAHGFRYVEGLIDDALELGVGGFLVDGGPREEVAALVARLRAGSRAPMLVAAHAERGAAQAVDGLTGLPPFGALAAVAVVEQDPGRAASLDLELVRRAARITARELRMVGMNWALAPVCDLDVARGTSRVGTRGAGGEAAMVSAVVSEWVDACQAESVVACAMHFPGIGRMLEGAGGGVVKDAAAFLRRADLLPFAAAIDAGAASVMVAAAAVPSLGAPDAAMLSQALVATLLRAELGFDGLVTTVPLDRESAIDVANEPAIAVAAVSAGCDVVLAPSDLSGVVDALSRAASRGELSAARVRESLGRVDRWAGWASLAAGEATREPSLDDVMWSRQLADHAVRFVSGSRPRVGGTIEVVAVASESARASLAAFTDTLRAFHIAVTESAQPTAGERAPLAAQFVPSDTVGDGVTRDELDRARAAAIPAVHAGRDTVIVAYCHPRAAAALGRDLSVVCAWEPSRAMQQAAARSLVPASAR